MTYNIRGGLGLDARRDTARIAAAVLSQDPDIVCFQEVHQRLPWSGWVDQPRRLGDALNLQFVFQPNLRFGFGGYGLGVATRFPILRVRRHRLPSVGEKRGALEVEIATPDGPVTAFCTHWGLKREERVRQGQAMAERMRRVQTPLVLCGDLNERPEADYVSAMLARADLRDCGAATDLPTYPSDGPTARIDVLCVSPDLGLERLWVVETPASDHLPVVADLRRQG